jgi:hypothetical protein
VACSRLRGCGAAGLRSPRSSTTRALDRMTRQIAARLDLPKIIADPGLNELGVDLTRTATGPEAAHTAVRGASYVLIVAHEP